MGQNKAIYCIMRWQRLDCIAENGRPRLDCELLDNRYYANVMIYLKRYKTVNN